jgi:hypothetical protein
MTMAKPRDPQDQAWADLKASTEAKYGKGWEFLSPEQHQGAYMAAAVFQVLGFRALSDDKTLMDMLAHYRACIIDQVVEERGSALA